MDRSVDAAAARGVDAGVDAASRGVDAAVGDARAMAVDRSVDAEGFDGSALAAAGRGADDGSPAAAAAAGKGPGGDGGGDAEVWVGNPARDGLADSLAGEEEDEGFRDREATEAPTAAATTMVNGKRRPVGNVKVMTAVRPLLGHETGCHDVVRVMPPGTIELPKKPNGPQNAADRCIALCVAAA